MIIREGELFGYTREVLFLPATEKDKRHQVIKYLQDNKIDHFLAMPYGSSQNQIVWLHEDTAAIIALKFK